MSITNLTTATPPRRMPGEALGQHLLGAVMTPAQVRRFRHALSLRVVIEVPTPAWIEPLRAAAATMALWDLAVGLDGTACGTRHPHRIESASRHPWPPGTASWPSAMHPRVTFCRRLSPVPT